MSVLVVGMSHRSAPVSLLERLSMDDLARKSALIKLVDRDSLTEAMIISTCNRLEVYVMTNSFHTGVNDVVEVLHEVSGVDIESLRGYLYVRYADAAAEHILVLSSGLDSMVIGEQQIIGQVRTAYRQAVETGTVGSALHSLAQTALHTGKRVHSETNIDDVGASMVTFAVDAAINQMGLDVQAALPLLGKTVMVLGAGAMSSLAATYLGKRGVDKLIIANRTKARAQLLADHSIQAGIPAEVVDYRDRASMYAKVDVIVSATGSHTPTVNPEEIPTNARLMLIDLSMPRDIDDSVLNHPGVELVNIESLNQSGAGETAQRDSTAALAIVREELEAFSSAQRVKDIVPAVAALRNQANDLVSQELEKLRARTPNMADNEWCEVTRTLKRVVDKLLHEPTVRVKKLAARSGTVTYESALQELFGIELMRSQAAPGTTVTSVEELPDASIVAVMNEAMNLANPSTAITHNPRK